MFDLTIGTLDRPYRRSSGPAAMVSLGGHMVLVLAIALPLLYVTNALPTVPTSITFVTPVDMTPPPPPPPPAPRPAPPAAQTPPRAPETAAPVALAPVEAPRVVAPEPVAAPAAAGPGAAVRGVEGGVAGGVVGGVVGGMVSVAPPPPPPPPPAPAKPSPVRVGGQLSAPALLTHVDPEYPEVAVAAQLEGVVILEATVGTDGCVEQVRVLRSRGMLDKYAMAAVKQWRYKPLQLNGIPTPFIVAVTVNFSLKRQG